MKPKHLQRFPRVIKIFPEQQWAFAGMTDSGVLNVKEYFSAATEWVFGRPYFSGQQCAQVWEWRP